MKFAKRVLAFLLTAMTMLTALPMGAFAATGSTATNTTPVYEGDSFYGDERLAQYEQYTTTWRARDYAEMSGAYATAGWNNSDYVGTEAKITVYYDDASAAQGKMDLIVYVINYEGERMAVGENADDDITIITDYIEAPAAVESGSRAAVMVVDFGNTTDAATAKVELSLTTLRIWLKRDLTINSKKGSALFSNWIYNLPAGYRVARDIPFFDSSVHGSLGTLDYVMAQWNSCIAGIKNVYYQYWTESETIPDGFVAGSPKRENDDPDGAVLLLADGATQKAPTVSRVEDCVKMDGSDMQYLCRLDILYPTGTHTEETEAPVYLMGATESARTRMVGEESPTYADSFLSFTFRGYATVIYDFAYTPMARDDHYGYISGFSAGYRNAAKVARAAMRCVRYYSDLYGYSNERTSGAGISKGSTTSSAFVIKDNTNLPEASVFSMSQNDAYLEGGAWADVYQPYSTYEGGYDGTGADAYEGQTHTGAVDSNAKVAYTAGADGTAWVGGVGSAASSKEAWQVGGSDGHGIVPTFVTFGENDPYSVAYNNWKTIFNRFENYANESFVTLYMEGIGHSYPTGHDTVRNLNRKELMISFFNYYLKDNSTQAPIVIGATPIITEAQQDGSRTVQNDSEIKVQFLTDMDLTTISNITVTNISTGEALAGTWAAINEGVKNRFEFTYEGELQYGATYRITVPTTVKGSNGVALAEAYTSDFEVALPEPFVDQSIDFEGLSITGSALTSAEVNTNEWLMLANPTVAKVAVDPLDSTNTVAVTYSPLYFHDGDGRLTKNTFELSYRMLWSSELGQSPTNPSGSGFVSIRYNTNTSTGETYILQRANGVLYYYSDNSTKYSTGISLQKDTWMNFRFLINPKTGEVTITISYDDVEKTFTVTNTHLKAAAAAGCTDTYFYPCYQWASTHSTICYDDFKITAPKIDDTASVATVVEPETAGFKVTFDDYNSTTDASTSAYINRVLAESGFAVHNTGNANKQVVTFDGTNGYIKATANNANEWSIYDVNEAYLADKPFTFSFDMKTNPESPSGGGGWFASYGNKANSTHYCFIMCTNGALLYKGEDGSTKSIALPSDWTQFKMVMDPATATFDLYVGGQCLGKGLSPYATNTTDVPNVNASFVRFPWIGGKISSYMFDNIAVDVELEQGTLLDLTFDDANSGETPATYIDRMGSEVGIDTQNLIARWDLATESDGNTYIASTYEGSKSSNAHWDILDTNRQWLNKYPFEISYDVKWNSAANQSIATCLLFGNLNKGYTLLQTANATNAIRWIKAGETTSANMVSHTISTTEWTNIRVAITPSQTADDAMYFDLWIDGVYQGNIHSYATDPYTSGNSYGTTFLRLAPSWNGNTSVTPMYMDNIKIKLLEVPVVEPAFEGSEIALDYGDWNVVFDKASASGALIKPADVTDGITVLDTEHLLIGTAFETAFDFRLDAANTKSVDMLNIFSKSALTLNAAQQLVDANGNIISDALTVGEWYNIRVAVDTQSGKSLVYLNNKVCSIFETVPYTGSPTGLVIACPDSAETTAVYSVNNIHVFHSKGYELSRDVLDLDFSSVVRPDELDGSVEWNTDKAVSDGVLTVNKGGKGITYHASYYDSMFKMFTAEMQVKLNSITGTVTLADVDGKALVAAADGSLTFNGSSVGSLTADALTKVAITADVDAGLLSVWVGDVRMATVNITAADTLTLLNTTAVTAGTVTVDDMQIDLVKITKPVMVGWQSADGDTTSARFLAVADTLYYTGIGFDVSATGKETAAHATREVYTSIVADGETYDAETLGGRYVFAVVVEDIPRLGDSINFTLTPYVKVGAEKISGTTKTYSLERSTAHIEDFEDHTKATVYSGDGSYDSYLSGRGWDYIRGGQYGGYSTNIVTESDGNKVLSVSGLSRTAGGSYSARIKMPNYVLDNVNALLGEKLLFTAKVKVANMVEGSLVKGSMQMMIDEATTWSAIGGSTAFSVAPADGWVTISHQVTITEAILANYPFSTTDSRHWPFRVAINLGSGGYIADTFYIDDVCVTLLDGSIPQMGSIYAEGMVLQKSKDGTPTLIGGYDGTPGDLMTVTLGGQSKSVYVKADGSFEAEFETEYTESTTLKVTSSMYGTIRDLKSVAIGEVWYCSGQSNMELKIKSVHNVADIIAGADNYNVRTYKIPVTAKYQPRKDVAGTWSQVTSSNVSNVSAIAYIAAYQLQDALDVPVAIIESYNGGSAAQAWLSYESVFAADRAEAYDDQAHVDSVVNANTWGWEGRTLLGDYDYYWQIGTANEGTLQNGISSTSPGNRFAPTALYNGMVAPLRGFSVAGVMWYQGEANNDYLQPEQYNYVLYDLINQWRTDFRDDDLPVMLVNLAPFSNNFQSIRQTQVDTHKRDENVGLIVTAYEGAVYNASGACVDLDNGGVYGNGNSVHPGVKVPVGNRMYNAIMNMVYGASYEYTGPEYETMTVSGNKAILTFTHADGLKIKSGDSALTGFTISADGTNFVEATATIVGNTVEVYADGVASPVAVRYAYVNRAAKAGTPNPEVWVDTGDGTLAQAVTQDTLGGNLENSASLPAAPFEATLADASLYNVTYADGTLTVEVREAGHIASAYTVVVNADGTETEYDVTFATRDSYVLTVATTASTVTVSLYDSADAQVGETVTCNK